jgi:F0F1-type ATP synthase assembly protein I
VTLDHDLTALTLEADLLAESVVAVLIGLWDRFWLWRGLRLIIILLLRLGG